MLDPLLDKDLDGYSSDKKPQPPGDISGGTLSFLLFTTIAFLFGMVAVANTSAKHWVLWGIPASSWSMILFVVFSLAVAFWILLRAYNRAYYRGRFNQQQTEEGMMEVDIQENVLLRQPLAVRIFTHNNDEITTVETVERVDGLIEAYDPYRKAIDLAKKYTEVDGKLRYVAVEVVVQATRIMPQTEQEKIRLLNDPSPV